MSINPSSTPSHQHPQPHPDRAPNAAARRDTLSPSASTSPSLSRSPSPSTGRTSLTPASSPGGTRRAPIELPGGSSPGRVRQAALLFEQRPKDSTHGEPGRDDAEERSRHTYRRRLSTDQIAQITKSHSIPYSPKSPKSPVLLVPDDDDTVERLVTTSPPEAVAASVSVASASASALGITFGGAPVLRRTTAEARVTEREEKEQEVQGDEEERIVVPIVIEEPPIEDRQPEASSPTIPQDDSTEKVMDSISAPPGDNQLTAAVAFDAAQSTESPPVPTEEAAASGLVAAEESPAASATFSLAPAPAPASAITLTGSTTSLFAATAAESLLNDATPPASTLSRAAPTSTTPSEPPSRPRSKIIAVNVTPSMNEDDGVEGGIGGSAGGRGSALAAQLDVLALSARMTEVDMMVQEVALLLFEVQELRHASSEDTQKRPSATNGAGGGDGDDKQTPVDKALARMNRRFDEASREMTALESAVAPYLSTPPSSSPSSSAFPSEEQAFLKEKWDDLASSWRRVDEGAETLKEELKEDAWLTVFRNASRQAEEMMDSLDKVLTSAQEFAWEVGRRRKGKERSNGAAGEEVGVGGGFGEEEREELGKSYAALQKSFDTKRKYYVPSCERVLRILGKGIEERSTKNGEVLRRWSAMKARFKSIQDRLSRTEKDLANVEAVLSGSQPLLQEPKTPSKRKDVDPSVYLSPDRAAAPPLPPTPGTVSPFRRFVNRITPSSSRAFSPSPSTSPSQASEGSPAVARKQQQRARSAGNLKPLPTPAQPPPLPHLSASDAGGTLRASGRLSRAGGRESVAKGRTSAADGSFRPPWNFSLRPSRDESQERLASTPTKNRRPGLPKEYTSPRRPSRPPSEAGFSSLALGTGAAGGLRRAASPSVLSDVSLSASYRPRKSVSTERGSRIPAPSWLAGGDRPTTPSLSNMSSYEYEEVLDSPPRGVGRTVSPAPSSALSTFSAARSGVGGTSRIPVPAESPLAKGRRSMTPNGAARYLDPTFSPGGGGGGGSRLLGQSVGQGGRRPFSPTPSDVALMPPPRWNARSHTPEPSIAAKAGKISGAPSYRHTPSRIDSRRPASRASAGVGGGGGGGVGSRPPPPLPVPATQRGATMGGKRSYPRSSASAGDVSVGLLGGSGVIGGYEANAHDALDVAIAKLVASQPLVLGVERVDPPLRPGVPPAEQVQYRFFSEEEAEESRRAMREVRPVMCKLTNRMLSGKGRRVEKVMVKVRGAWSDLELHLLEKQGQVR